MGIQTKNFASLFIALGALAALAGCGDSAPSDKDVQAAMSRQLERTMGVEAAQSQAGEFAKIKVVKCAKAELGGFSCEIDSPMGGRSTGRFKKEGGEWILAGVGG